MPDVASGSSSTTDNYRPLSALALVGLGLGVLAPLSLISLHPGLFAAIPLPGFFVSLVARRRIVNSDGIIAGKNIATVALALNLVSGLAWLSMYVTTAIVIQNESRKFVEEWIEKLRQGKEGEVFLDTRPPKLRKINFAPTDLKKLRDRFAGKAGSSELDAFRAQPLNNLLLRYGDHLQWDGSIGIVEWKYYNESYSVRHRFIVRSDDGRIAAKVDLLASSEIVPHNSGPRREWKITVQGGLNEVVSTAYMQRLDDAQKDALTVINRWVQEVAADHRDAALKYLKDPTDRIREAEFSHLYNALRKDATALSTTDLHIDPQRPLLLVKDVNYDATPNSWQLTFRGDVALGQVWAVEMQATIVTDDFLKGPSSWKIAQCKLLTEHRQANALLMSAGGGPGGPQ
jgi:hypothetical protein